MNIQLNGENKSLPENTSVIQLLIEMGLADKRLAVELNQEILPASLHKATLLKENDHVEIVHAIGGG